MSFPTLSRRCNATTGNPTTREVAKKLHLSNMKGLYYFVMKLSTIFEVKWVSLKVKNFPGIA
jgi:hypothetical protein